MRATSLVWWTLTLQRYRIFHGTIVIILSIKLTAPWWTSDLEYIASDSHPDPLQSSINTAEAYSNHREFQGVDFLCNPPCHTWRVTTGWASASCSCPLQDTGQHPSRKDCTVVLCQKRRMDWKRVSVGKPGMSVDSCHPWVSFSVAPEKEGHQGITSP